MNLRSHRSTIGISQSRLARISGVSRFKICTYELGGGSLTSEEQRLIQDSLQAEADRLRRISPKIEFDEPKVTGQDTANPRPKRASDLGGIP